MLATETQEPHPHPAASQGSSEPESSWGRPGQGQSTPTAAGGRGRASAGEARVKVPLKENSWERGSQSARSQLWGPSAIPAGGGTAAPAPPASRLGPPPAPWPWSGPRRWQGPPSVTRHTSLHSHSLREFATRFLKVRLAGGLGQTRGGPLACSRCHVRGLSCYAACVHICVWAHVCMCVAVCA